MAKRPKLVALGVGDLAMMLSKAIGRDVPVSKIESEIAAGAPTNADGSIDFSRFVAWLVKRRTEA